MTFLLVRLYNTQEFGKKNKYIKYYNHIYTCIEEDKESGDVNFHAIVITHDFICFKWKKHGNFVHEFRILCEKICL